MPTVDLNLSLYLVLAIILVAVAVYALRILREYERGVIFTLGRFSGVKGPRPHHTDSDRPAACTRRSAHAGAGCPQSGRDLP